MNRGVSSSQKTLKKYGPLRTHSGDIVSFRENKIGHRSSENGAMHDIDFGDVLSTLAPVAASVATKTPQKKKALQIYLFSLGDFKEKRIGLLSSENGVIKVYRSAGGGVPPPTLQRL